MPPNSRFVGGVVGNEVKVKFRNCYEMSIDLDSH